MRALKLLVVAMGVLILTATAVLVTIVINRAGQLGGSTQADRTVSVPQGFHITATDLSGDRLLVRLEGHAPGEAGDEVRLMVFDLAHGASVRMVRLVPSGAPSQSRPR